MNKNIIIKVTSLILATTFICATFSACGKKEVKTDNPILDSELSDYEYKQTHYNSPATNVKKEETVYINTKPNGETYNVSVTDWLHTDTPQTYIKDVSNLTDIVNVNTLTKPQQKGEKLVWDMDTTDLYYNGKSKEQPPVSFSIKYFLEGKEMTAEQIAGKKGNVSIQITMHNSKKEKYMIKGKEYTITCPMLVAGGTILPEDTFQNIAIDYGKAISDGAKQIVFFAGIPNIDESLGISELKLSSLDKAMYTNTYTITAYTEKFELGNFMFVAMPFSSVGSLGVGGLTDGIDSLKQILSDIDSVQKAMDSLGVQKIIDLLYGDSDKIGEILGSVKKASELYKENEKMLKVFGSYMTPENIQKLNKLIVDLENTDIKALEETLSDPMLRKLLNLLPKLSENLSELTVLANDINDLMPLFEEITKSTEDPQIQESLKNLPQTLTELQNILNTLNKNKKLIESIGNFANADNLQQVEVIIDTADKYVNLADLSKDQIDLLADRAKNWINMGTSYKIFTKVDPSASSTVLFTYKSDSISAPEEQKQTEKVETDDNKFVAWFKNLFK